jgi:hypothetical protein
MVSKFPEDGMEVLLYTVEIKYYTTVYSDVHLVRLLKKISWLKCIE